jgi:(d)CTP diphosphatase
MNLSEPHSKKTQVIAAVIQKDGRFLLGKRSPHKNSAPAYWCPVSGRIEANETQEQAVSREVLEEVGLVVRAIEKVGEFDTHDGSALIHWWKVEILSGTAKLMNNEHSELRWVTIEDMQKLEPIFQEDRELFEKIRESKKSEPVE